MSWVTDSRAASAAAACWTSNRSTSTQRPRDCTSGRACRASRLTSSAVSSASSNSTVQATLLSWRAPTTESAGVSANSRSDAFALRRESAGSRTSNPIVASVGPVVVMNSHASSWLIASCPRRDAPTRSSAGSSRPSRCHSALSARLPPSARIATSIGTCVPLPDGAETDRIHTPPGSGGSSWIDQLRPHRIGDRARPLIDPPRQGCGQVRRWQRTAIHPCGRSPCRRGRSRSSRSTAAAGSSIRSMLSVTMASTAAVMTADVVARPSPPPTATTAPGIIAASEVTAARSIKRRSPLNGGFDQCRRR